MQKLGEIFSVYYSNLHPFPVQCKKISKETIQKFICTCWPETTVNPVSKLFKMIYWKRLTCKLQFFATEIKNQSTVIFNTAWCVMFQTLSLVLLSLLSVSNVLTLIPAQYNELYWHYFTKLHDKKRVTIEIAFAVHILFDKR